MPAPDRYIRQLLKEGGSAAAIAARLGGEITRQNVEYWVKERRFAPHAAARVEQVYGICVEDLRPDLHWVRVPDATWPGGQRPTLDVAKVAA
jgi:DNA-binding transcriptional regulator YdaS (Cro superfamily)